jgi:hypothetical protein
MYVYTQFCVDHDPSPTLAASQLTNQYLPLQAAGIWVLRICHLLECLIQKIS